MELDKTVLREYVYDCICGNLNEEAFPFNGLVIKSEFEDGSKCAYAYHCVMDAYTRLCARLNVPEWADADVEIIINEFMQIAKLLAMKMFDYGMLFGKLEH